MNSSELKRLLRQASVIAGGGSGDLGSLGSAASDLVVIGSQTVGSTVTAKYLKGSGTLNLTRTVIATGVTTDIGTTQNSGATYVVQITDRGCIIGARPVTYLPGPASGLTIPTVAPLAPTINSITPGNAKVTVGLTRNADNGGDTVMYDRVNVYGFASDTMVGTNTGAGSIDVTGLPTGLDVYARAATYGATNGLGPWSAKSSKVTTLGGTGGGSAPAPVSGNVGPYALGNAYTIDGRSYKATDGDDFDALSYVSPANPAGKYGTTRVYMSPLAGNGPRGNNSGSNTLKGYDGDPLHTGYNDANRGQAMSSLADTMTVSGGRLKLKSRVASSAEKLLFANSASMPVASAMLNTATSHVVMAPFVVETKMKLTKAQANMGGWHPSFWMMQMKSATSWIGTELDWEGDSLKIGANKFAWNNGASTSFGDPSPKTWVSGTEYTFQIEVLADGSVNYYTNIAGGGGSAAVAKVRSLNAGTVLDTTRPFYVMFTNHVADFASDPYADADWVTAGATGATMDIDYFALLTDTGLKYAPLLPMATVNVDYGTPLNIALPSATDLWGAAVTEDIESFCQESNEPGGDYAGGYLNRVYGLTYDLSALTITGTPTAPTNKSGTNNSGRIMVERYTKVPGSTCVPHRTVINIGPHLTIDALPAAIVGQAYSYDLYAVADCGALVSDSAGNRKKTLVVTGLPAGLTYSDATGLITGTPSAAFSANLSVTITNSVGQTITAYAAFNGLSLNQGAAAPVITGSPAIRNSWDFDNLSSLTIDGTGMITSAASIEGGTLALANASAGPTRAQRQNKRYAALFDKTKNQYLQGSAAQATGGTQIIVFEHNSTNATMQLLDRGKASVGTLYSREGLLSIANGSLSQRRCTNSGNAVDASSANAQNTTTIHVAVLVFDPAGTGFTMYLDGASTGFTNSTTAPTGMDTVTLGGRWAASALSLPYDGYVYRVIDYPVAFTAAQAEEAAVWARKMYGTPNQA